MFTQWKLLKCLFALVLLTTGFIFAADQSKSISLDGIKMNVIKTAENGVVNHETIFLFSQKEGIVSAEYQGGKISKGFLVGKLSTPAQLEFSYCQMQIDGKLDNGVSTCQLSKNENGKITLTEHFEWKSRPGEFGTNVFQEL
jgi:hypothetical protein